MTQKGSLGPGAPRALRWILGPNACRRVLVGAALLIGGWMLAAGALYVGTVTLEILAWQPLHRGNYEGAEPLLEAGAALSRAASRICVPGQRVRLAAYLGDLGEAREQRGATAEAAELYLESTSILEAELGPDDSQARYARWRYHNFLRSTGHADDGAAP